MNTKEITFETLQKTIEDFSQKGILFSNERQFQLELAFKLKENYSVYLEMLDYSNKEKKYIDIVVDIGNNELVAIELKYTTLDKNILYMTPSRNVYTFKQGAGDIRRFHYLKDVERIEHLIDTPNVFGLQDVRVVKGFAIIMTNDNYYKQTGEKTQYEKVALNNSREIKAGETLKIGTSGYTNKEIKLKNSYTCNWYDYKLNKTSLQLEGKDITKEYKNYPFRYMILEINPSLQ